MITGFNTDIEYQGVTYHVQTEDKGVKTPLILSLVYNRGTILASKRSPYNDLLTGTFDENQLAERLQKQHKLICAAIRSGRLEDLKRMTAKAAAEKQNSSKAKSSAEPERKVEETLQPAASLIPKIPPVAEKNQQENPSAVEKIPQDEKKTVPEIVEKIREDTAGSVETISAVPAAPAKVQDKKAEVSAPENVRDEKAFAEENVWEIPLDIFEDAVILDDVQVIDEEVIVAAEAVQVIEESPDDETINQQLKIEMLDNIVFKSGERKALALIVRRGNSDNGLEGVHIMVKVTGASFRPLIFHSKTDENGTAVVHLQLPHFRAGRAAVLIKAMSGGEEVEVRRSIQHD